MSLRFAVPCTPVTANSSSRIVSRKRSRDDMQSEEQDTRKREIIAAKSTEEPLQPPNDVLNAIPPFHLYGPKNCSDHLHNLTEMQNLYETDQSSSPNTDKEPPLKKPRYAQEGPHSNPQTTPFKLMEWVCSDCVGIYQPMDLHDLPCGHMLCLPCLEERAREVPNMLGKYQYQLNRALTQKYSIESKLQQHDQYPTSSRRTLSESQPSLLRKLAEAEQSLSVFSGRACCGINMELFRRFARCLTPETARQLWLAEQWLDDHPDDRHACGWPDCEAYVPPCCVYELPAYMGGNGDGQRWWCVRCEGNSRGSSNRKRAQDMGRFPWLRRGTEVLLPSR
ncbi:hypothetical protein B0H63DRAFT_520380 [Podospora didyma]|uniref:RING-type domain-containing protein n=1 Tax=Podospora didyma TaxID=330526 RepID=A0AAE0P0R4_9PEZI|nr:hypothetical protein B0H63DRAFT_520380 [Podospora didyma]